MQLPKNILQIGQPDDFYHIYIEDYVYTYINQFEKEEFLERKKIYLFGKALTGEQTGYFYIYGAADSDKGILSTQHEFFPEYNMIGTLSLFHGEKEVSLQNGITFPLKGFYVFYEQNDAMQNFLIHNFHEKKEIVEEIQRPAPVYKIRQTKPQEHTEGSFLYIATFSMAIVICIIAITAINQYDKMLGFNQGVEQAANLGNDMQVRETDIRNDVEDDIHIEETHIYIEASEQSSEVDTTANEEAKYTAEFHMESEEYAEEESIESEEVIKPITEQIYIVQQGDTLVRICNQIYGDEGKVRQVCEKNNIENPDDIIPGQKLVLP